MIALSKYYHFSAEDVEYIEATTVESNAFPHRLTVRFKSGKECTVNYKEAEARDSARDELVRQIDREKRAESEKIQTLLWNIRYTTERIDKRELRIWRQLRDLLGISVEED